MSIKKRKCAFCDKPATRIFTPMLGTIPKDPQGSIHFKYIGIEMLLCDKHELRYECAEIESYPC